MSKDDPAISTDIEQADAAVQVDPESLTTEPDTTPKQATVDVDTDSSADAVGPTNGKSRWPRRLVPWTIVLLLLAALGVASWLYVFWYRADQQLNELGRQTVLNAASDGVVAVLTYSPDTLDADFTNAKKHLTGDFLNYYSDYTQTVVTPAAKEKAVKTTAAVVNRGIIEFEPNNAQVLLFINQTTTSKSMPDGSYSTSAVKVTMQRHDGNWLISAFDPV